jgi:hypothetical protein
MSLQDLLLAPRSAQLLFERNVHGFSHNQNFHVSNRFLFGITKTSGQ